MPPRKSSKFKRLRWKIRSLLSTTRRRATAAFLGIMLLSGIVLVIVLPTLHAFGLLGGTRSLILLSHQLCKGFFLTSYRSSDSASKTHYINATAIQIQAGDVFNYLGCFQDSMWVDQSSGLARRTLDGISFDWSHNKTMTNQHCADLCSGLGYSYFGTEYCWFQLSSLPKLFYLCTYARGSMLTLISQPHNVFVVMRSIRKRVW